MTELMPCPFCGAMATLDNSDHEHYRVFCEACGATTSVFASAQDSVWAWNRRAGRTCRIESGPSAVFKNETGPDWTTQDLVDRCSGCGHEIHRDPFTGEYPRFCPNCGARVEGE